MVIQRWQQYNVMYVCMYVIRIIRYAPNVVHPHLAGLLYRALINAPSQDARLERTEERWPGKKQV